MLKLILLAIANEHVRTMMSLHQPKTSVSLKTQHESCFPVSLYYAVVYLIYYVYVYVPFLHRF